MHGGIGGAGFPSEPADSIVGFRAGLLAVIAAHTQRLIDQQYVRGLTDTLLDQERDNVAATRDILHTQVFGGTSALLGFHSEAQVRILFHERLEGGCIQTDRICGYRRFDRCRT